MKARFLLIPTALILAAAPVSHAAATVSIGHSPAGSGFAFDSLPLPARNDAASTAEFTLVDGERDSNGGLLAVLHDGRLPVEDDEPAANVFFRAGTDGGRIRIDLKSVIPVKQVNTYSWHTGARAPQVYRLYAADGAASGFVPSPRRGTDPESCGWTHVAAVDTRERHGSAGGQYGVAVSDPASGKLGDYRYLLLDVARTEAQDAFGNTFYGEVDVLNAHAPPPEPAVGQTGESILIPFGASQGKCKFTIDATAAPDLAEWADAQLRPVVQEWYPKIVAMLPSDGFEPATNITLRFRTDMGGTPASAGGNRVNLNSGWFRRELRREALGAVVHELVHVVQDYGRARRLNPGAARTPGWLVEGIADYIRWFLYEPETRGAEITERNLDRATYDASYRISGNFLDWVTRTYDRDIVPKLNGAAREGRYARALWEERTGKTLDALGEEWKKGNETRIHAARSNGGTVEK